MCLDKVARSCPDERTRDAIVAICLDLADKAHAIETTFVISKGHATGHDYGRSGRRNAYPLKRNYVWKWLIR